jgi:hypothetical protein
MNIILQKHIIIHIFSNFMIIPSDFVNQKSPSLMDKKFLLNEKLSFELEDGSILKNKIWGCQFSADEQELNVLLGDCSLDINSPEYCLIIQLKNCPAYGLYLTFNDLNSNNNETLIACSLNQKDWMNCNTFLQSTFLTGMEQIKELGLDWHKISNYKQQYEMMLSFINHYENSLNEGGTDIYEGEENRS